MSDPAPRSPHLATYLDVDDAIRTGMRRELVLAVLASARIGHPGPWADIPPGTSYVTDAARVALKREERATSHAAWLSGVLDDAARAMGTAITSVGDVLDVARR